MRTGYTAFHIVLMLFALLAANTVSAAAQFAAPAFAQRWQQDEARTPNVWGPLANARDGQHEPYAEGIAGAICPPIPNQDCPDFLVKGERLVQYFDKGRMELTTPNAEVTSGLLATELITGQIQVGEHTFQSRAPATIPIVGDPDNPGPTYAMLGTTAAILLSPTAASTGMMVSAGLSPSGVVTQGDAASGAGPEILAVYDRTTHHNVPQAFARYREMVGLLTIGYATSEPFLTTVKVAGEQRRVMVQVFERRVLTYTADNPDPFKVEMGNIGQQYYQWRYGSG